MYIHVHAPHLYQTVWPELHGVGVNADINIPWFIETAASNSIGKVTALGVLCCFALFVCLTLRRFFLLSLYPGIPEVRFPRKTPHSNYSTKCACRNLPCP